MARNSLGFTVQGLSTMMYSSQTTCCCRGLGFLSGVEEGAKTSSSRAAYVESMETVCNAASQSKPQKVKHGAS